MMYHFMLGLRSISAGGASGAAIALSAAAATGAAATASGAACGSLAALSAPATASVFSSSCMGSCIVAFLSGLPLSGPASWCGFSLATLEIVEQSGHAVLNEVVDHGEIQPENEDRDDDHRGRGADFLPGGR